MCAAGPAACILFAIIMLVDLVYAFIDPHKGKVHLESEHMSIQNSKQN